MAVSPPIQSILPQLIAELAENPVTLLTAPAGSGKTTCVPPHLLQQSWLAGNKILMLEPRRLAAKAAAMRIAWLLGEEVGQRVGYRVRMERRVSAQTRIEVVTEGVFIRQIQRDPELSGIGMVIFDEFHERSLDADLSLAFGLDVVAGLREDLRLLIMSATLDTGSLASLIPDAGIVKGGGFSYPVDIRYLEREPERNPLPVTVAGIQRALSECNGDMLVFLPGRGEIEAVARAIQPNLDDSILLYPLYGDLTRENQTRALHRDAQARRRVILSTSIAESSLTIDGISTVVDSGWSRRPRFDPNSGLTRLETVRLSQASADQRAGRAGRTQAGVCYRLWGASTARGLVQQTRAEILDADMAPLILQLALWGVSEVSELAWLDQPPAGAVAQARGLLTELEALDEQGRITTLGRRMARLPLHPRLAHMLVKAAGEGQLPIAADLAAIISERDILRHPARSLSIDIDDRLQLLSLWRREGAVAATAAGADRSACRRVIDASRQLRSLAEREDTVESSFLSSGVLLSYAYPDRMAQRRNASGNCYLMASGRAVNLPEGEPLTASRYLVVASLDAGRIEGRAFLAAKLDLSHLCKAHAERIKIVSEIKWEQGSCAVKALVCKRLGALTLDTREIDNPDAPLVLSAMLAGIRSMGLESLPWNRTTQEWRTRVAALRRWQPEEGWPDVSDAALLNGIDSWLAPWLNGVSRRQHLKRLNLEEILQNLLDWPRRRLLDELAPTHIRVPSGAKKRLDYTSEAAPVLKVRLQEMFGATQTPSVCRGEIPVMLHLLSPAQRPVQITRDLRGFWQKTYQEVRKELKGRYPKHYWPENPWQAEAVTGVRPGKGGKTQSG